ncbi:MAG: hypothetical protein Ct9H300mP28_37350 [Pseudomonadota bacterium]|nr:MAG: hypothetical protein Ct9H300mP28_37350 [Pseudomonadota bacterium]
MKFTTKDSKDKGIAEISIAKHRNGAIGPKRLAFIGQYTKFANLALGANKPFILVVTNLLFQ